MSLVIRTRVRSSNRLPELHQSGQTLARTQRTGSLSVFPYELLYPLFGTLATRHLEPRLECYYLRHG
jgi:hypothetical protein